MEISKEDLDRWFTAHMPDVDMAEKFVDIRSAGKIFAEVILRNTKPGSDQGAAIRKVREAVMTANCSIACEKPS